MAKVDLHAGDGAANLFGLSDQIVALMGDILQQRADPHLVVGIGALERGDFIGNQGFEFAGARNRALDAVAHRRDFAADRLTDGHHRVAGRSLRLGKTDRHLRHRLRDHPHFLAAPGKAGEEVEQHHRHAEQGDKTGQHQDAAALAHRRLNRGQEAEGQQRAAGEPDAGDDGEDRKHAAGRAALLNGLQELPDGFAVVIGGAAGRTRLLDRLEARPIGVGPRIEGALVEIERALVIVLRGRVGRREIAVGRTARIIACRRVRDVQGFLNGRKRDFCGVFDLFGIVRHVQSEPSFY